MTDFFPSYDLFYHNNTQLHIYNAIEDKKYYFIQNLYETVIYGYTVDREIFANKFVWEKL
jgi:hypothetical protein